MNRKRKQNCVAATALILSLTLMTCGNVAAGAITGGAVSAAPDVRIVENEASQARLVNYSDPAGNFTAMVPEGWTVRPGLMGSGGLDYISYAVKIYDPSAPDRMVYLNLNCAGMLKSQAAKDWHIAYSGSYWADMPVLPSVTTEGFFQGMGDLYGYSDFTVGNALGRIGNGGDLLEGTYLSGSSSAEVSGLFSAWVTDYEYMANSVPYDIYSEMIDVGYCTAYSVIMEAAPANEFLDWQPVLESVLSSIQFTDSFLSARRQEWQQTMAASSYFMQTASEISDMVMSSWENRNTTYDILSQKQSDATLGFERVYDTETGDVYKAYNGFTDDYSGTRFAPVTDDMYLKATSGEIVRESGTGSSSLVSFRKVSISENASATGTATYYDGKGIFHLVEGTDISDQDVSVRPDSDSASDTADATKEPDADSGSDIYYQETYDTTAFSDVTYTIYQDGRLEYKSAYFLLMLPADWYGKYYVEDTGTTLAFYHIGSYDAWQKEGYTGGLLFSVGMSHDDSYKELPSYYELGETHDQGQAYLYLPTDVQAYTDDADVFSEYNELFNELDDIEANSSAR